MTIIHFASAKTLTEGQNSLYHLASVSKEGIRHWEVAEDQVPMWQLFDKMIRNSCEPWVRQRILVSGENQLAETVTRNLNNTVDIEL